MGRDVPVERFRPEEYRRFAERLRESLEALRLLLGRPEFGRGPSSMGAELELCIVDGAGRPYPVNRTVLDETRDPRLDYELDRFNLECNLTFTPLAGASLPALHRELREVVAEASRAAATCDGRILAVGILPTLSEGDLQLEAMSDVSRYRILADGLRRARKEPFRIRIDGPEPLDTRTEEITYEGANTSFQVHLRVPPDAFTRTYNAAQIAIAPLLAAAANSPSFLGHLLWDETRVALFKQAVDARSGTGHAYKRPGRVTFGREWLRGGVLELFETAVTAYPPLIPAVSEEDPLQVLRGGAMPGLDELRLHSGTVWRWNRPVFDPADGGHVRIEMRALPAGPTATDMTANAAFLVGASIALAEHPTVRPENFPFAAAHNNFYRAAQFGLDARLQWPTALENSLESVRAGDLLLSLLPLAREGLERSGVPAADAARYLQILEARARSGRTGAEWQRRKLKALEREMDRPSALRALVQEYIAAGAEDSPVHEWP